MALHAEMFEERSEWRKPLMQSLVLHAALFGGFAAYAWIGGNLSGESWGGATSGGGAMSATLVSTVPLPSSARETENIVANESRGLARSEPQEQQVEPDAIPLPAPDAKLRPPQPQQQRRVEARKPEPPKDNVVPFGQGGPVSGPYGVFSTANAKGGFSFGAGGDFGSRYGWYVDVVRKKVSENWLKYEIDAGVDAARRVYITFDIQRDGTPGNVRVSQTSGIPSLDQSAVRAIQRIDTFGGLPRDYSGSRVSVEFWFDYRR